MSRRRKAKKTIGSVTGVLSRMAPYVAFAQQLTEKDLAILPANRSRGQQLKDFSNIITGRMGGFHLFNGNSDYKPPFTLNPSAIVTSKWVQGGLGMIAYSIASKYVNKAVGKTVLPKGGTIGKIGSKIAFGGGIGALFDAPSGGMSGEQSYTAPTAYGIGNNRYSPIIAPSLGQSDSKMGMY